MESTKFRADTDTYAKIRELFVAFSHLYVDEDHRVRAIKEPLRALLGREPLVVQADKVKSDGAIFQSCGEFTAYILVQEVKNEIGTAHSDPFTQGSLSYRKYWIDRESKLMNTIPCWCNIERNLIKRCCCPSLILAIAGPWACVAGGVYIKKTITQPLTNYVWLGGDPFDPGQLVFAARLFAALKSAIRSLEHYYRTLDPQRSIVSDYPYITEYGPSKIKFTYSSRLATEQQSKLVYKATQDDVHNTQIVVKFAYRYNAFAHRLLATNKLAPQLHYSSTEDNVRYGKHFMIVMDYVGLEPLSGLPNDRQYKCIQEAINILHSNNVVFGDLRPPNILVGDDTAMLIDFDWCGEAGKGRYPPEINPDESIGWHPDVGSDCLMIPDHDMYMLHKLRL